MKKTSNLRSQEDIKLLKIATEKNSFFKLTAEKFGPEVHGLMCHDLEYKNLLVNQVLFEVGKLIYFYGFLEVIIGSMGTTFYIILKGKVAVLVRIPVTNDEGAIINFNLKEVTTLGTGSSFGELAIIEDLKPRAATIIAKEPCHLAVLGRESYKKCLGIHQKKELDAKIEFLLTIPLFKSWSIHALMKFTYSITIKTFIMKQIIYKENIPGDDIYIIRSGEVISSKNIEINYSIEKAEQLLIDDKQQVYTYKKEPFSKIIKIAVLSVGHIFGEEEAYDLYKQEKLLDKLAKYDSKINDKKLKENILRQATMTCSSLKAEIWYISKKNFFSKLEPYTSSFNILISMIKKKAHWKQERIKEIVELATSNINYLVGNSTIKTRPSSNNDINTIIKYKQHWKNLAQTTIKSNHSDKKSLNLSLELKIKEKNFAFINKSFDAKNSIENNEISKNFSPERQVQENGIGLSNNQSDDYNHKNIVIAENPNIKYWDLKLDTKSAMGTPKEGSSKNHKKISSFKVKPIYNNPEILLSTALLAKKKLQEKLQLTSFANKDYYNSMHEYNKMNRVSKIIPKVRDRPNIKIKERIDRPQSETLQSKKGSPQMEDNSEENKSLSRLVNILKSISKFNKYEDDENSQIYGSLSIDKRHENYEDRFSKTPTNLRWAIDNRTPQIKNNEAIPSFMNTRSSFDKNSNLRARGEQMNDFEKLRNYRISIKKISPKYQNFRFLNQSKDSITKKPDSPITTNKFLEKALSTTNSKFRGRIFDFDEHKKIIKTPSTIIHSFNSYKDVTNNKN